MVFLAVHGDYRGIPCYDGDFIYLPVGDLFSGGKDRDAAAASSLLETVPSKRGGLT